MKVFIKQVEGLIDYAKIADKCSKFLMRIDFRNKIQEFVTELIEFFIKYDSSLQNIELREYNGIVFLEDYQIKSNRESFIIEKGYKKVKKTRSIILHTNNDMIEISYLEHIKYGYGKGIACISHKNKRIYHFDVDVPKLLEVLSNIGYIIDAEQISKILDVEYYPSHLRHRKYKCKKFISFRELFNDPNEPVTRGICLVNPIYDNNEVRFAIVDESICKMCEVKA